MNRYCPHCGEKLMECEGTLKCIAGDMPLAPWMLKKLEECIEGCKAESSCTGGTGIFCFCCGIRTQEKEGNNVCIACGATYQPIVIHRLVELHPHLKTKNFVYGYVKNA